MPSIDNCMLLMYVVMSYLVPSLLVERDRIWKCIEESKSEAFNIKDEIKKR